MAIFVALDDRTSRLQWATAHPPLRDVHGECADYSRHPDTVHFRSAQVRFYQLRCLYGKVVVVEAQPIGTFLLGLFQGLV